MTHSTPHTACGDPPDMPRRTPRSIEVHGWASDNYTLDGFPPVIVNPKADALSLLSWGLGQLQQCNAVLDAMFERAADNMDSPTRSIVHFNKQAETVIRAGVEKLFDAQLPTSVPPLTQR